MVPLYGLKPEPEQEPELELGQVTQLGVSLHETTSNDYARPF